MDNELLSYQRDEFKRRIGIDPIQLISLIVSPELKNMVSFPHLCKLILIETPKQLLELEQQHPKPDLKQPIIEYTFH